MNFSKMRHLLFYILLAVTGVIFLMMVKPFFFPIFWAAIIAALFYPVHRWIIQKIRLLNLSAAISLLVVLVVIILPLTFLSYLLIKQSADLYNSLDNNRAQIVTSISHLTEWIKYNPYTAKLNINESFWIEKFSDISQTIAGFVFNSAKSITQNSLVFIALFIIMLYALFFFIRDGEKLLKSLMHVCPLGDKYEKLLYQKFTSTARAALKGTVIVGGIQGTLGALLFWYCGIQGALIWGLLMTALSIIPPFSSALIWLPAGIIMMLTGKLWTGLIIIAFGALLISTIDNILRPLIVGKDTEMHPLLVLFSTLGGILVFGISGFIIGPILTALFLAFWEMYDQYYKEGLDNNK